MSAEQRKPTPKEAKKGKNPLEDRLSIPQELKAFIGKENYRDWGFEVTHVILWRHHPTVVYLGEIKHHENEDFSLNLVVLQQFRIKNNVVSVHWYYADLEEVPLKRRLEQAKTRGQREDILRHAAEQTEPRGAAILQEKIERDVRRFKNY